MNKLKDETFICLDCETTGLDVKNDRIIEIACVKFNSDGVLESFETLVNPHMEIPQSSTAIHNITQEMIQSAPPIEEVLAKVFAISANQIIVGHGIEFDLNIINESCLRHNIPNPLKKCRFIDTLRLARHYGEAPKNSLTDLRVHFNVEPMGAHRAMGDVLVNIEVFHHLSRRFKSLKELFDMLSHPIEMRRMPLGKHKGRLFKEVPLDYLKWACHQDFDQDLIFSIRSEINRRKKGDTFFQSTNPFNAVDI